VNGRADRQGTGHEQENALLIFYRVSLHAVSAWHCEAGHSARRRAIENHTGNSAREPQHPQPQHPERAKLFLNVFTFCLTPPGLWRIVTIERVQK
jgi:hypothetical protein